MSAPCDTCGRNFNPESLVRHAPICAKNAAKKPRKAFNVQKQRVQGTDINYAELKRNEKKKPTVKEMRIQQRKHNWREKHEEFVSSIRAARGEPAVAQSTSKTSYGSASSYGGNYGGLAGNSRYEPETQNRRGSFADNGNAAGFDRTPPTRRGPVPKAGFVQCPHCNRNFGEEQAERHIPFCAEQAKKKAMRDANAGKNTAAIKMAARTQYRPPKPKSTTTYSPSVKSSGYGIKPKQQPNDDFDRFSNDIFDKPRLAPSAGRRAKENVLNNTNKQRLTPKREKSGKLRRTCHDCSTIYPVEWAKFCCECGTRRIPA